MTAPRLSLSERLARWDYLSRVEFWLGDLPRGRRKAILTELRGNIAAATPDEGLTGALAALGRPRDLAADYTTAEPRLYPSWTAGVLAAAAVAALWLTGAFSYCVGMLDALAPGSTRTGNYLGMRVHAWSEHPTLGVELSGFSWVALVVAALAFLVASRCWRLATGRPQ